jgi:hypothetical protein
MRIICRSRHVALVPVLAGLLVGMTACVSPTAPDEVRVDPIQIDTVTVMLDAPAEAKARIRGAIGDGCSTLKSVTQSRSGNAVTLTILRERPVNAVCTQQLLLYDETIRLEGTYPSGSYTLTVNGLSVAFEAV